MEKDVGKNQCGFRGGRSVVDQILIIREIRAESREHNVETFVVFITFQYAFEILERKVLFTAMTGLGINKKKIRLIEMILDETIGSVRINGQYTKEKNMRNGLRQAPVSIR